MPRRLLIAVLAAALAGARRVLWLNRPEGVDAAALPVHAPDADNGARPFWAGGCASCHAVPGAKGDDKLLLAGGVVLRTPPSAPSAC